MRGVFSFFFWRVGDRRFRVSFEFEEVGLSVIETRVGRVGFIFGLVYRLFRFYDDRIEV